MTEAGRKTQCLSGSTQHAPVCGSGMCDRPAVASLYHHGTILIRDDHFHRSERATTWRCLDCLHDDLDLWLAGVLPLDCAPDPEEPSWRPSTSSPWSTTSTTTSPELPSTPTAPGTGTRSPLIQGTTSLARVALPLNVSPIRKAARTDG